MIRAFREKGLTQSRQGAKKKKTEFNDPISNIQYPDLRVSGMRVKNIELSLQQLNKFQKSNFSIFLMPDQSLPST